jgi:CDP-diacylglycerol--serine O-phosphatidyltransferase
MRKIYILPSLFTSANAFCGFLSIILIFEGRYPQAAIFILIAILTDSLDGKLARLTKTTSKFGIEFDSLADLTSFGIAPALLAYKGMALAGTKGLNEPGWIITFLFFICGALRLARFNIQPQEKGEGNFTGLPIPAAAGVIASSILLETKYQTGIISNSSLMVIMLVLSCLMVSNIPYPSFKKINLRQKKPLSWVVSIAFIISFIYLFPRLMFIPVFFTYLLSGPVKILYKNFVKKHKLKKIEKLKKSNSPKSTVLSLIV